MKIAYIAHPIGGDVKGNLIKVLAIVKHINRTEPDTVPFVPYFADLLAMDDNIAPERTRGIKNDHEFFARRCFHELRLYGDHVTSGMEDEISLAVQYGIRINPCTRQTADWCKKHKIRVAKQLRVDPYEWLSDIIDFQTTIFTFLRTKQERKY